MELEILERVLQVREILASSRGVSHGRIRWAVTQSGFCLSSSMGVLLGRFFDDLFSSHISQVFELASINSFIFLFDLKGQ